MLAGRALIDIIFSNQKPAALVAIYTITILSVSFYFFITTKALKSRSNLTLLLLLFSSVLLSLLNSNVAYIEHLNFSLQVLIPIIFLLACTGKPSTLTKSATKFKKLAAVPLLILILVFSYLDYKQNNLGQTFFDYYANNPNHVFAQTSLKISLLFMESIPLAIASFALLGLLNVRSTIMAFTISFLMLHKKSLLKKRQLIKIIAVTTIALILIFTFLDVNQIFERAVFKNRTTQSQDIENISSGRSDIYLYYIQYLLNNYSPIDWLIGRGPIWLDPKEFHLSAHNDILNILISYGLTGFTLLGYAYYKFFSSLPSKIIPAASLCFIVLFVINGVIFHQSTILFCLLYIYSTSSNESNTRHKT